jgi:hypothetical protein
MPNETVREHRRRCVGDENASVDWVDREIDGCEFRDERLGKRFRSLLEHLSSHSGGSIPPWIAGAMAWMYPAVP